MLALVVAAALASVFVVIPRQGSRRLLLLPQRSAPERIVPSSGADQSPHPSEGVAASISVEALKDRCRAFSRHAAVVAARSSGEFIRTAHSELQVVPRPVCMKGNSFFHAASAALSLRHTNTSQVFTPLDDEVLRFYGQHGGVQLEPRLALMYTGQWSNVNLFHLLNDLLAGVGDVFHHHPDLGSVPLRVVYVANTTFNTKWRKRHCAACSEWGDGFTSPATSAVCRRSPAELAATVVVDDQLPPSSTDVPLKCFCHAAVAYGHSMPFYSKARSDAYLTVKLHAARYFGVPLYPDRGEQTTPPWTLWKICGEQQPRLLIVDRRGTRRLVQIDELVNATLRIGFCVRVVRFEEMTGCEQFAAARGADVLMSVHGMALAAMLAMDGTQPETHFNRTSDSTLLAEDVAVSPNGDRRPKSCRSVVELMHWVRPNEFWYYKELAAVNNLTLLRETPVDVVFGRSVVHKEKEKKLLMKNTFWWGLKGFDDQTPLYNMASVSLKLRHAYYRALNCAPRKV
jgi:hypothetical protein